MNPLPLRATATALRLRTRPEIAPETDTGGRLLQGQLAEAWGESFDKEWYFVATAAGVGWASAKHLERVPPPAANGIETARARLGLRDELLPKTASNRPGTPLRPAWVTVHNTANPGRGANAKMHCRYLLGDDARSRQVSWHFTVDDTEAVRHIPVDEVAWHAGSRANESSIGVEICEHAGIDQAAADDRAALLVAVLLAEQGIPLAHVRTHKSWTGKECPRILLQTPGGWERFLARVGEHFAAL